MWTRCKDKAERLRWARQHAGYKTAAEAVQRLGVKQPTYNLNENGGKPYSPKAAKLYAKCFRVSWEWLYFGTGSPFDKPWKTALQTVSPPLAELVDRLIYLPDTKVNKVVQMVENALSLDEPAPELPQPILEPVELRTPATAHKRKKLASG